MKTIIYVDGYNLFYGCLKHSGDKWLDLWKLLVGRIVHAQNPASEVIQIKFFTADILAKIASHGQDAMVAQQSYHRALERIYSERIKIIKGFYSLEKAHLLAYQKPPDKMNRVAVWRLVEKQTDVNIALEAYRDAVKGLAKQFIFVSNDTDLAPALLALREDCGADIRIGVIIPVRATNQRPGNQALSTLADWTRSHITDAELITSHLPDTVPTKKKPIKKPIYW